MSNGTEDFKAGEEMGAIKSNILHIRESIDRIEKVYLAKTETNTADIQTAKGAILAIKWIGGIMSFLLTIMSITSLVMAFMKTR